MTSSFVTSSINPKIFKKPVTDFFQGKMTLEWVFLLSILMMEAFSTVLKMFSLIFSKIFTKIVFGQISVILACYL